MDGPGGLDADDTAGQYEDLSDRIDWLDHEIAGINGQPARTENESGLGDQQGMDSESDWEDDITDEEEQTDLEATERRYVINM